MTSVEVVDAATFEPMIPVAAHIYGAAMHRSAELVVQRREIIQAHVVRRDFAATIACTDRADGADGGDGGELVGFGYGYRGRAGEWWHDVVAGALHGRIGRAAARAWLDDAFELAELHLHPDFHGHGTGRSLLEQLLAVAVGSTVVLSTHDRESPARSLYRSVGFVDLVNEFRFPGSAEVYVIMGLVRSSA